MLRPDSLIVITHSLDNSRDLLPLWTGLGGAALGIIGTVIASVSGYRIAKRQLDMQKELAESQLAAQRLLADTAAATQQNIADRQIRATVLSSNRMRWIEQVREQMAAWLLVAEQIGLADDVETHDRMKMDGARHAMMLSLLLDHRDPVVRALKRAINDAIRLLNRTFDGEAIDRADIQKALVRVKRLSRKLLKAEWERVKRVE